MMLLQDKKKHKEVESTFWGVVLMLGYLGYDMSALGPCCSRLWCGCVPAVA